MEERTGHRDGNRAGTALQAITDAGTVLETASEEPLAVWLRTYGDQKLAFAEVAKGIGLLADDDSSVRLSRQDQGRLSTALRAAGFETKNGWNDAVQKQRLGSVYSYGMSRNVKFLDRLVSLI